MIIDIPDDADPKTRRKALTYLPIKYALSLFNYNISKAAAWLGYTPRRFRDRMHVHPDLKQYISKKPTYDDSELVNDPWKKKREAMVTAYVESIDYLKHTNRKREEEIKRIRALW